MTERRLEQRQTIHEGRVRVAYARDVGVDLRRARIGAAAIGRADAGDIRFVRGLEKQNPALRIKCRAAPVGAADQSRTLHGPPCARGREQRTDAVLLQFLLRGRLQRRRRIERIVERDALFGERGRLRRKRLRRPRVLAIDIAWPYGPFFDRPHRRAADAVEHEREPLLRKLHDGVDGAAVDVNRHEARRRGIVVIPQPVVHEADDRLAEEARPWTAAAVEIVAGRGDRQVDEPARFVERHRRPDVGVTGVRPRIVLPRVVAELAGLRNRVERPHLLPGARAERADVARRIILIRKAIANAVAEDHEVLVDDRRGRVCVVALVDFPDEALAQVGDAARAETLDGPARRRVEAEQAIAAVDENPQRTAGRAVSPGGHAAVHETGAVGRLAVFVRLGIERPPLSAGVGIQGDDPVVRRAEVQHVIDHQRRRLKIARPRAEFGEYLLARRPFPRDAQARDVRTVNVGQGRKLRAGLVAAVIRPIVRAMVRLRRHIRLKPDATYCRTRFRDARDEKRGEKQSQHRQDRRIIMRHASISRGHHAIQECVLRLAARAVRPRCHTSGTTSDDPNPGGRCGRWHRQSDAERDSGRAGIQNHGN